MRADGLAEEITRSIKIPLSVSVPVLTVTGKFWCAYMLGYEQRHRRPRFVKDFMAEAGSIQGAFEPTESPCANRHSPIWIIATNEDLQFGCRTA